MCRANFLFHNASASYPLSIHWWVHGGTEIIPVAEAISNMHCILFREMRLLKHVFYISEGEKLRKKATIHQVTTMLATSETVLFPGHNCLQTTGTDDLTLWLSPEH